MTPDELNSILRTSGAAQMPFSKVAMRLGREGDAQFEHDFYNENSAVCKAYERGNLDFEYNTAGVLMSTLFAPAANNSTPTAGTPPKVDNNALLAMQQLRKENRKKYERERREYENRRNK